MLRCCCCQCSALLCGSEGALNVLRGNAKVVQETLFWPLGGAILLLSHYMEAWSPCLQRTHCSQLSTDSALTNEPSSVYSIRLMARVSLVLYSRSYNPKNVFWLPAFQLVGIKWFCTELWALSNLCWVQRYDGWPRAFWRRTICWRAADVMRHVFCFIFCKGYWDAVKTNYTVLFSSCVSLFVDKAQALREIKN